MRVRLPTMVGMTFMVCFTRCLACQQLRRFERGKGSSAGSGQHAQEHASQPYPPVSAQPGRFPQHLMPARHFPDVPSYTC